LLHERLTTLYKHAEAKFTPKESRNPDEQSSTNGPHNNNNIESKDVAPLLMAMQNIAVNLFKLESEGLRMLASRNASGIGNYEQRRSVPLIESGATGSGKE
jgi:hypothetical protein